MPDVDAMAKSGKYFATASWFNNRPNFKAVAKAVEALGGHLEVVWDE
jgi:hypothetical protein